jgi:hypothetical protein
MQQIVRRQAGTTIRFQQRFDKTEGRRKTDRRRIGADQPNLNEAGRYEL